MQSAIKVVCDGFGGFTHKPRTVAQFRFDDGWARVNNEGKPDPILLDPAGASFEVITRHALNCDRCSYSGYFKPENLYRLLDKARSRGWMPAPL